MFAFFFAEKIVKSRRVMLCKQEQKLFNAARFQCCDKHILMQTRTETFQCCDISENRHHNYILACIQMSVGQKTAGQSQ